MKLLSHVHINGNGYNNVETYARCIALGAKQRGYTHSVFGCHENFVMPSSLMNIIQKEYNIIPIRFMELSLKVRGISKYNNSHISFINLPEKEFKGFSYGCDIEQLISYAKEIRCKVILNHPNTKEEIIAFSSFIDGYEIINGLDTKNENYSFRNLKNEFPNLIQFYGADYHVWELKGNMDLYNNLPDDFFGKIFL